MRVSIAALLLLAVAACTAEPTPTPTSPFMELKDAYRACEDAFERVAPNEATADEWAAGQATCQEARQTRAALIAEAEIARQTACSRTVLLFADSEEDYRSCIEATQDELDIAIAHEDHLDRLYRGGVSGAEERRRYFGAAQDELDAMASYAAAIESGEATEITEAETHLADAQAQTWAAYQEMMAYLQQAQEDWLSQ